ncbi:hypothetical protein [Alkalimonas mucilaginosa]|uniref:Uncharacterized protein n=1 Tax=Alkalimonas mucilaginosa TaxID=3057676 RepID=A0ABU7JCW3_9GAMM|nr:hypothetical protein [Alkalimonas sp. MEB004]MEE2023519.1 hypothetical protein [Alkalimonas sp. MEB004]
MITLSLLATGMAAALVGTATNPGATMTTPEVSSVERLDVIGRRNHYCDNCILYHYIP